jgi:hypothetical protein
MASLHLPLLCNEFGLHTAGHGCTPTRAAGKAAVARRRVVLLLSRGAVRPRCRLCVPLKADLLRSCETPGWPRMCERCHIPPSSSLCSPTPTSSYSAFNVAVLLPSSMLGMRVRGPASQLLLASLCTSSTGSIKGMQVGGPMLKVLSTLSYKLRLHRLTNRLLSVIVSNRKVEMARRLWAVTAAKT